MALEKSEGTTHGEVNYGILMFHVSAVYIQLFDLQATHSMQYTQVALAPQPSEVHDHGSDT